MYPKTVRDLNQTIFLAINANKKIIYASLTAYGEKGPDSKRTAFDATAYYARSGLMEWSKTNNADDHPPFPIPGGGDHPTGLSLFTLFY